jgi:ubiquinone/menaquinone biosynthesis C-methylase UbiE
MRDLAAFFDILAPRWDSMQPPAREVHLARLLAPHTALLARARRILDVGTGTGAFLPHLHRLAPHAEITGLDLSREMLRLARSNGRAHLVRVWLRGDAQYLPLADGQMDLITCHDSFAHFEDHPATLREFRRVLAPGGRLLILHDISREQVNTIHGRADHPRVQTHQLPPITDLIPVVEAADFTILAAEDTPDHYLIAAQRT